jgi:hypothetical protein
MEQRIHGKMKRWDYARVSWLDNMVHLTCTDPEFIEQALAGLGTLFPESAAERRQDPAGEAVHLQLEGLQGRGYLAGRWLLKALDGQGWDLFQVDASPSKRSSLTFFLSYFRSGYYHFRRQQSC